MDVNVLAVLFKIANAVVMPQWFAMAIFPNNRYTKLLVDSFAIPLALAILYAFVIFWSFTQPSDSAGNFSSLEGVKILFTSDIAVLAGWIHYLAFDLLVGRYIFKQAEKLKANRIITGVCLFLTLMFGPIGFLMFSIYSFLLKRNSITTH
jgi:hypothetical protein